MLRTRTHDGSVEARRLPPRFQRTRGVVPRALIGVTAVAVYLAPGSVSGDRIVTVAGQSLEGKILGFEAGALQIREADGQAHSVWIDEVQWMDVDRGGLFDDFNQAERFVASNEPDRALPRYRRALRVSEGFWTDLIAARIVLASEAAGELDTAILHFVRLLRGHWGGPPAAARLIPKTALSAGDRRLVRAIESLDGAIALRPAEPQQVLLELLRYELLRRTQDQRAKSMAGRVSTLPIPDDLRSVPVYAIRLEALRQALSDQAHPELMAALDGALRDAPVDLLPDFFLLKGETLFRSAQSNDELIRAAWSFLRVPIHFSDHARAPDGLYAAALVLDRMARPDKARELLNECLTHPAADERTRKQAEAAMERLPSTGSAAPADRGASIRPL